MSLLQLYAVHAQRGRFGCADEEVLSLLFNILSPSKSSAILASLWSATSAEAPEFVEESNLCSVTFAEMVTTNH